MGEKEIDKGIILRPHDRFSINAINAMLHA
jgi:hypothetical protein